VYNFAFVIIKLHYEWIERFNFETYFEIGIQYGAQLSSGFEMLIFRLLKNGESCGIPSFIAF